MPAEAGIRPLAWAKLKRRFGVAWDPRLRGGDIKRGGGDKEAPGDT